VIEKERHREREGKREKVGKGGIESKVHHVFVETN